jgi:hypothetical protein
VVSGGSSADEDCFWADSLLFILPRKSTLGGVMSPPSILAKVKDDPGEEALSGATSVEVVVLRTLLGLAQAKPRFLTPWACEPRSNSRTIRKQGWLVWNTRLCAFHPSTDHTRDPTRRLLKPALEATVRKSRCSFLCQVFLNVFKFLSYSIIDQSIKFDLLIMHESIFSYTLSRPYPYRWFTWVVFVWRCSCELLWRWKRLL